jgi:methionine aminopeptidase
MRHQLLKQRLALAITFLFLSSGFFISAAQPVEGASESFTTPTDDARDAANITAAALNQARNMLRRTYDESITQQDVCDYIERVMRFEGADVRLSFPTLTMSGVELEQGHGNPHDDKTHVINPETEPIVMIDAGSRVNGHCSDVTRTFFFEGATTEMLDAYAAVVAAEEAIIEAIAPGVDIGDLDAIHTSSLSAYIGEPGITTLTYWGHGVDEWVHAYPTLGAINAGVLLTEGMVLAIEPGIYTDDGWAVRVEDTVLVTSTGYEVLSSAMPKALENVTIASDDRSITGSLSITGYEYGSQADLVFSVSDSERKAPRCVMFHDGFSWITLEQEDATFFTDSYFVGYWYSEITNVAFRISIDGRKVYWIEELVATPDEFTQHSLLPALVVSETGEDVQAPLSWTIYHSGASMIRVQFASLLSPVWEQFSILDSFGRVVIEYKGVDLREEWTPWIAGEELTIIVYPVESYIMDSFSFEILSYETVSGDVTPSTTTTTTTTTTTPTPWTPPPNTTTTNNLPEELDLTVVFGAGAAVLVVLIVVVIGRDLRS